MDKTLFSGSNFSIIVPNFNDAARPRLSFKTSKQGSPVTSDKGDGFTRIRSLGMVALENSDNSGSYPKSLGQSVKIRAYYTQADLNAAGGNPLKLAYWNGSKWVVFATPSLVAGPVGNNAGYGDVTFTSTPWNGDPELSWGK